MEHDYKIIVRNSCIIITDYNWGDCPKIENNFRIYERITHTYNYIGIYYDEENKLLYLPRGIDIWYVEQCFEATAYIDKKYGQYDEIGNCKLKVGPRNDRQKEALRFMIGMLEFKQNQYASQLLIAANPGFGKTYLSVAAISYFEIKSIIITYSITWLDQWKDRITQYTGISEKEILFISGSAIINKLFKMSDKNRNRYKLFLVTHSTIKTYADENGWDKIGELFKILRIGIKIYDEAHLNFLNMSMIDFFTNTYKTYYLTATPGRSSEEENIIYGRYFKNVPCLDLFDDNIDPHTKYIAIKYDSRPSVFDLSECKNQYGLDRNKYINYLIYRPCYYKLLSVILDLALKIDGKCLIFIGTNAAIQVTYKWIQFNYPELYDNVGIFTTMVTKEEKKISKDKKIILSTLKSAGAAVDIADLKMTVVLNEPFKSHVTAQQSLGRTRAEDTYYIDCIDLGFMHLRKYYTYKKPVFEKYAISSSEIYLKEDELNMRYNNIIEKRKAQYSSPLIKFDLVYFD